MPQKLQDEEKPEEIEMDQSQSQGPGQRNDDRKLFGGQKGFALDLISTGLDL